jgi:hypothetical protein
MAFDVLSTKRGAARRKMRGVTIARHRGPDGPSYVISFYRDVLEAMAWRRGTGVVVFRGTGGDAGKLRVKAGDGDARKLQRKGNSDAAHCLKLAIRTWHEAPNATQKAAAAAFKIIDGGHCAGRPIKCLEIEMPAALAGATATAREAPAAKRRGRPPKAAKTPAVPAADNPFSDQNAILYEDEPAALRRHGP